MWQTHITKQGLDTLRRLLKKTARRNTAIACRWFRGHSEELLWIIGDASRFNEQGAVPTNTTQQDVLNTSRENSWHTMTDISLLAGIAALFHDFGKANSLFQNKLRSASKKKSKIKCEPYRHEWVSLRLFEAFVGELSDDAQWLEKLAKVSVIDEKNMIDLARAKNIGNKNPFDSEGLPALARVVGWLIISHHRLPQWDDTEEEPKFRNIEKWMSRDFNASWNSPQHKWKDWKDKERDAVWAFENGTPLRSSIWLAKAHAIATRALDRPGLIKDWLLDQPFSMHVARMVLMLADHYYSSQQPTKKWQDPSIQLYANTDRETRECKQQLDEHIVGVTHHATKLARLLPGLRSTLPAITRNKAFKRRTQSPGFQWQDKAYELAMGLRERTKIQGFFGVNMASTGCGKTLANARIMYGLADEQRGCRFNVALGLRTLTLQTGDALRARLNLDDEDLAVLIGSSRVQTLHELREELSNTIVGSESAEELLDQMEHVRYEGTLDDGALSKWLRRDPKMHQLVSAPIVVSTIDHLIGATESQRGGKQIAPMLRLLTSDLIIDEPDDFDLDDLPALCRLVNWAGMLGSRVLISSATLPPDFVHALFDAYQSGWKNFRTSCLEPGPDLGVCSAWFDEHTCQSEECGNSTSFMEVHRDFVEGRVARIQTQTPLRLGTIVPVQLGGDNGHPSQAMANAIHTSIHQLHQEHAVENPVSGKRLSLGLVRMANINPLVAVTKALLEKQSMKGYQIHYCVYHSRHPLVIRSTMERLLDEMLKRHDPLAIWKHPLVVDALVKYPADNHVFVVLASPVAEVGRDHDYDWAIAEPSSMRSIIQLAGRIQRHRKVRTGQVRPNLHILERNFRALRNENVAFCRPGYESKEHLLNFHSMTQALIPEQYIAVNSIPRIRRRVDVEPTENLVDLEHFRTRRKLLPEGGALINAAQWWNSSAHWSYEVQRRTRFRESPPQQEYCLVIEDEDDTPRFHFVDENGLKLDDDSFRRTKRIVLPVGVSFWKHFCFAEEITRLADLLDISVADTCRKFGCLQLTKSDADWFYDPLLGVYQELS